MKQICHANAALRRRERILQTPLIPEEISKPFLGALHGYPHSKSIPGEMAGASRIGAFLGFLLLELLVINVARWIS